MFKYCKNEKREREISTRSGTGPLRSVQQRENIYDSPSRNSKDDSHSQMLMGSPTLLPGNFRSTSPGPGDRQDPHALGRLGTASRTSRSRPRTDLKSPDASYRVRERQLQRIRSQKSSNRNGHTALASPPTIGGMGEDDDDNEDLELMYDPVLNCYFDPKTNKYYELK